MGKPEGYGSVVLSGVVAEELFFGLTEDSDIWTGRRETAENSRRWRDGSERDSNGRNQFASTIKGSNSRCYVD